MKLKRLFSILALAIFGASSVGIGASLLSKAPVEANAVEAPKTWMFRAQLNLLGASPNKEGNAFGANPVEKVRSVAGETAVLLRLSKPNTLYSKLMITMEQTSLLLMPMFSKVPSGF